MNSKIIVCYTISDNYSIHCITSMKSILLNANSSRDYNFWIFSDHFSLFNKFRFLLFSKRFRVKVNLTIIDDIFKETFIPKGGHFSSANYWRIILASKLICNKAIYLDADTIILNDLHELWSINIENHVLAGVRITTENQNKKRLNLSSHSKYINSGVMLLNIDMMRKISFEKKCLAFIQNTDIPLTNVDQDVINFLFNDKILLVDDRWNVQIRSDLKYPDYYKDVLEKPYILHFLTADKPWNSHESKKNAEYHKYYWFYRNL